METQITEPNNIVPIDFTCIPPKDKIIQRNEYGLICSSNIHYIYNDDGTINWRKMIPARFLAPNEEYFNRKKREIPKSIEGLEDYELIILLGGMKELSLIRGYSNVRYEVVSPSPDYVITTCSIDFIPNFETENKPITFSAIGDASLKNTSKFGKDFLGPMAENRAFTRCVRNFLRIHIVTAEELKGGDVEKAVQEEDGTTEALKNAIARAGLNFLKIKEKLISENFEGAAELSSLTEIPKIKQFELIERINKAVEEKAEKKTGKTKPQ